MVKVKKYLIVVGECEYEEICNNFYIIYFLGYVKFWSKDFEGLMKKYYEKYVGMMVFCCVVKFFKYLKYVKI